MKTVDLEAYEKAYQDYLDKMKIRPGTVERMFCDYLFRVRLWGKPMTKGQYLETKRAFYAWVSAMLVEMVTLGEAPEEIAIEALTQHTKETGEFWELQERAHKMTNN